MASGLTSEIVLNLMRQGMRQTDIATEYGVTRQYVGKLAKQGGYESPITEVTQNLPWDVPQEYFDNTIYKYLRLHGHRMHAGVDSLSDASKAKLRAFYRKLKHFNMVVDYSPDYPQMPGVTNTPGFAYVPRVKEDGNYVIRIREGINLTSAGRKLWKMPKDLLF
ncbi:hypothetical protein P4N68_07180 [Corynebacterium felinum]|uniref:Uncharacterized protein n=1 Tax=Corynebacterium felinum TaxID=131318 RepID=A0ABU2B4T5_9CORY|nr:MULTISPECIES: hypothetical protein [Corynebacterium]MDF5820863.1 hypothetical protein [Corynebacterium felinum]MDO4762346.1 hypothetical protein [Corynebacterium sp.]MDR7353627.1 hypothetical protein [Corynebacterium felinum]WJY95806.1 hypothetical protein CFELI_11050 [Corynebacterium felinum]